MAASILLVKFIDLACVTTACVRECCRTLLYELVSGEFPWTGLRPEEIMWLVINGDRQSLAGLGCNSVLKVRWSPVEMILFTEQRRQTGHDPINH